MNGEPRRLRSPAVRRAGELLLPAALLLWRLIVTPPADLWRDWIAALALFWGIAVFRERSREWPFIALAAMGYLLGIYLHRQIGHTFSVLGVVP